MPEHRRHERLDVVGQGEVAAGQEGRRLGRAVQRHARAGTAAEADLGTRARRSDEVDEVVLDRSAHLDRPDRIAHREELLGRRHERHRVERFCTRPIPSRDAALAGTIRVAEADPDEEPVELGLGQRECALELDRVLGREDQEGVGQGPGLALDRTPAAPPSPRAGPTGSAASPG